MDENRGQGARNLQETDGLSSRVNREQSVSPDRILSTVADEHRRAIIDSLNSASENTLEYDTLVDRVADTIREEDGEGVADDHRQRVRISLRHIHLPKLEETQVIDYDAEEGEIQFVGGELVQEALALAKSHETNE